MIRSLAAFASGAAALAASLGPALPAAGETDGVFELRWSTVDAGGVTFAIAAGWRLGATAGQPDAGLPLAGGSFVLRGGFWLAESAGIVADLGVTKDDGQATAVPGTVVTYTIVASNAGPGAAVGALVSDGLPKPLQGATWTCTATAGSTCTGSGTGGIEDSVTLLPGGSSTYLLTATVNPAATGLLVNRALVTAPSGITDPNSANDLAIDTDTLTPQADLAVVVTDLRDPVPRDEPVTYSVEVANNGPSASPGATLVDTLPAELRAFSAVPGPPTCTLTTTSMTCTLGSLAPGASQTVTLTTAADPNFVGVVTNTAAVAGSVPDPVGANDTNGEATTIALPVEAELHHGARFERDLASSGVVRDEDHFRIRQEPRASYEVVVDGASGDVGVSGPGLFRVAADTTTVVQISQPVGAGFSRSLRWINGSPAAVVDETVLLTSNQCTLCGADDTYRISAWETTASVPRFNNSGTQVTVLLLQNPGTGTIAGTAYFWNAAGALVGEQPFSLAARQLLVLNTSTAAPGVGGSITVAHDGPYGVLAGKTVALEPATGYSFDSPLAPRTR